MNHTLPLLPWALLLPLVCPPAFSAEDAKASARTAKARALVEALAKKDYGKAGADFDATMKKALPESKRKEVWEGLLDQVGPFRKQLGTRAESKDGYRIVLVTCRFDKMDLDVRVVFDKEDRVTGLR